MDKLSTADNFAAILLGNGKMASRILNRETCDFNAHCDNCDITYRTTHGEKPMRIVARDMAWHTAPQKVRYCDNSSLKKWA